MSFPLFQRPGTVVFLDDDHDYLEMLGVVLPRQWMVKLFSGPQECINYLQQEPPLWEADAWNLQEMISQWRSGRALIPQILAYWASDTRRYGLTKVCVVDYAMPSMDGLQALGELIDWPGSRILLTGQADEQVAVNAFNRGLIDHFMTKQAPDISRRLMDAVSQLLAAPNAWQSQLWRATLTPEQMAALRVPSVVRDLSDFAARHWVEHVVLGDPFGVLGLSAEGQVSWLQLESTDRLGDLAELARADDVDPSLIAEIRKGKKLIDLELRLALGHGAEPELKPAFALGRNETLIGALFQLDRSYWPPQDASYNAWLARQTKRRIEK
ncbi:MAG: response regulator [Burkholderiaceae bacterium]|nr:response regulator [Burkholderiaceae bacterium]MDO9089562.1 response regulator [Burkholderiaceae bacterium]MDP1968736.1 response regulator [Burkholderiaceae bacterium]